MYIKYYILTHIPAFQVSPTCGFAVFSTHEANAIQTRHMSDCLRGSREASNPSKKVTECYRKHLKSLSVTHRMTKTIHRGVQWEVRGIIIGTNSPTAEHKPPIICWSFLFCHTVTRSNPQTCTDYWSANVQGCLMLLISEIMTWVALKIILTGNCWTLGAILVASKLLS